MIPHSSAGQPDGYGRRYAGVDGPADHRQAGGRAAAGAGAVGAVTGAARASAGAHPGAGIGATSGARARARAAGGYCVLALGRALRIAYCVLRIGAKGQVGFPIRLGGVSYTIRILMYLDVSCVYPEGYMYPLCILMYLKCILPALLHSKRIHVS